MQCSSLISTTTSNPTGTDQLTSSPRSYTFTPNQHCNATDNHDQLSSSENVVSCALNYDTFPIILFHYLPLRAQKLIAHRLKTSPCPLFVLVTSSHGQWCLVQLAEVDPDESDETNTAVAQSNSAIDVKPSSLSILREESETQPEDCNRASPKPDWPSEQMNTLQINLDSRSVVQFSGSSAVFYFKTVPGEGAWRCPFCGASFALGQTSTLPDILVQHVRRHMELRCCVDCVTLLPNGSSTMMGSTTELDHKCSELVSPTRKSDTEKRSLSLIGPRPGTHRTVTVVSRTAAPVLIRAPAQTPVPPNATEPPVLYVSPLTSTRSIASPTIQPSLVATSNLANTQLIKPTNVRSTSVTGGTRGMNNSSHPLHCSQCDIYFKFSAQYQQHLKNVHRGHRFLCQDCDASFSTKGNLTTHFQQVHNRNAVMQCPICDRRLSNKYNIERHMRLVHPDTPNPTVDDSHSATLLNASEPSRLDGEPDQREQPENTPKLRTGSKQVNLPGAGPTAVRDLNPTENITNKRGFYLYLFSPDQAGPEVGSPSAVTRELTASQRHLVADVHMTPCPPGNPNAKYISGGTMWHPCIRVAEPWLVKTDAPLTTRRPSPSSSCPPP